MKDPHPYSYMRWHRLSGTVSDGVTLDLEAASCCDGIPVLARWVRKEDGTYAVLALDGETQSWETVSDSDEECVPRTPPTIWSDELVSLNADLLRALVAVKREMDRHLVVMDRAELDTSILDGTGIATANGYRRAIQIAEAAIALAKANRQTSDQ